MYPILLPRSDGFCFGTLAAIVALIVGGSALWHFKRWRAEGFVGYLFCIGLMVGLLVWMAIKSNEHEFVQRYVARAEEVRARYPFESLEKRVPPLPASSGGIVNLSQSSHDALRTLEKSVEYDVFIDRIDKLRKLHDGSVEEFIRREGFGVARILSGGWAEYVMENAGRNKTSVEQPSSNHFEIREHNKESERADKAENLLFHNNHVLHFVNPAGFGVMNSRRQVAGFQAHQFNERPAENYWNIQRLELVSILVGKEPRVYVTAELPKMQAIRDVPTRALDPFEVAGLAHLNKGNELFVREVAEGFRMMGAIRSTKQCLGCHGGERGDLLGAFSYSLSRIHLSLE